MAQGRPDLTDLCHWFLGPEVLKMNKLALASAVLALVSGATVATQPSCSYFDARVRGVVNKTIDSRDSRRKQDLEDIMRSVHCVRSESVYRRVGKGEQPTLKKKGYGTAFAYKNEDGETYLTTNHHVVASPDSFHRFENRPGYGIVLSRYAKISERHTLVDNALDKEPEDDINVDKVRQDKDLDIAILKSPKELYVSDRFVFDSSINPRRGEEAYILGFPKALVQAQTRGVIAQQGFEGYEKKYDALDVNGTFGNSGSPYFVRRGKNLYWAGTVGALIAHRNSATSLFMLGIPLRQYAGLLSPKHSSRLSSKPQSDLHSKRKKGKDDRGGGFAE